jgi:hypothetical protein
MTLYCGDDGAEQPGVTGWDDCSKSCHGSFEDCDGDGESGCGIDEELSRRLFGPLVDLKTGAEGPNGATQRSSYPSQIRPSFRQLLQLGIVSFIHLGQAYRRRSTYLGVALSQPPFRRDLQVMHPPRVHGVPDRRLRPVFWAETVLEAMMCATFVITSPRLIANRGWLFLIGKTLRVQSHDMTGP